MVHLGSCTRNRQNGAWAPECGSDEGEATTANHVLVTCPERVETSAWKALHSINWGGEPCNCRGPAEWRADH